VKLRIIQIKIDRRKAVRWRVLFKAQDVTTQARRERLCIRFEFCPLPPPRPLPGWELSGLPFFAGGVVGTGRVAEVVDTASPPLPPFFPPVPVETGSGVDETTGLTLLEVFGSFPPFPPLPVGDGTAGEVEGRFGEGTVELRTLEEGTSERVAVGLTAEVDSTSLEAGGITEDEVSSTFDAPLSETVK
jgi:hypothetical protein